MEKYDEDQDVRLSLNMDEIIKQILYYLSALLLGNNIINMIIHLLHLYTSGELLYRLLLLLAQTVCQPTASPRLDLVFSNKHKNYQVNSYKDQVNNNLDTHYRLLVVPF